MYLYTHIYIHTHNTYLYLYIWKEREEGAHESKVPGARGGHSAAPEGGEGVLVLHVMLPMIISVPEGHLCFLRYVRLCQPVNRDGGADETAICGALNLSWALWAPLHPTSRGHLGPWRSHVADRGPLGTENGAGAAPRRPHSESQPGP